MRKLLLILGGVASLGAIVAGIFIYRLYNKPHRDIAAEAPAFTLTETELLGMFTDGAPTADEKLKNKVVQISGTVKKAETGNGITNLTFDSGGSYIVSAALDSTETKPVQSGAALSVKGLYVGFIEGDEDFGIPGEVKIKNGFVQ